MTTPDEPPRPSGWGDAPQQPGYGQPAYGQGQYGQGQYGQRQYGQDQYGTGAERPPSYPQGSPYGSGPYGPAAAKPGIVPLRPLSLGEVYDGAFGAIRHNPGVMLGAATLVLLVAMVLGVLVGQPFAPALNAMFGDLFAEGFEGDPALSGMGPMSAQLVAASAGMAVTSLFVTPVIEGILTVSVSQSVIGRKLTGRETWERLRPRVWVLVGWSLLRGLGLGVLFGVYVVLAVLLAVAVAEASDVAGVALGVVLVLAGIALLVWLSVRLVLVAPALALEGRPLGATIRRAWRLTRRSFWRLFGVYVLAAIIVSIASSIVSYPFSMVGGFLAAGGSGGAGLGAAGLGALALTTLGTVVATAMVTIFLSAVVALLYVDVRMRREGLDVALAAAAAEGGNPPR